MSVYVRLGLQLQNERNKVKRAAANNKRMEICGEEFVIIYSFIYVCMYMYLYIRASIHFVACEIAIRYIL